MKITGLDDKIYHWKLTGYLNNERECSDFHETVRVILKELYPLDLILEEVFLPGSYGLFADFYLPARKKMVECQGRQHYEYVHHFHGDKMKFGRGKVRDANKRQWCEINGITLIALNYKDKECEWRTQISKG